MVSGPLFIKVDTAAVTAVEVAWGRVYTASGPSGVIKAWTPRWEDATMEKVEYHRCGARKRYNSRCGVTAVRGVSTVTGRARVGARLVWGEYIPHSAVCAYFAQLRHFGSVGCTHPSGVSF